MVHSYDIETDTGNCTNEITMDPMSKISVSMMNDFIVSTIDMLCTFLVELSVCGNVNELLQITKDNSANTCFAMNAGEPWSAFTRVVVHSVVATSIYARTALTLIDICEKLLNLMRLFT